MMSRLYHVQRLRGPAIRTKNQALAGEPAKKLRQPTRLAEDRDVQMNRRRRRHRRRYRRRRTTRQPNPTNPDYCPEETTQPAPTTPTTTTCRTRTTTLPDPTTTTTCRTRRTTCRTRRTRQPNPTRPTTTCPPYDLPDDTGYAFP